MIQLRRPPCEVPPRPIQGLIKEWNKSKNAKNGRKLQNVGKDQAAFLEKDLQILSPCGTVLGILNRVYKQKTVFEKRERRKKKKRKKKEKRNRQSSELIVIH